MYDELVKRLRDAAKMSEALAVLLPHSEGNAMAKLHRDAADAIEELLQKTKLLEIDFKRADDAYHSWFEAYQKDVPRWIPVTERLPEQFKPVLVYYKRNGYSGTGVAEYYHDGDTKVWRGCGFIPTYWMPLPEPPKEGEA